jgi:hypothetical protein
LPNLLILFYNTGIVSCNKNLIRQDNASIDHGGFTEAPNADECLFLPMSGARLGLVALERSHPSAGHVFRVE